MLDVTLARALHVLAVVHWIGGVSLVTLAILPAIRRSIAPADRLSTFEAIEGRFALQARFSVTIAGLSGFWMVHRLGAWERFLHASFFWMHLMVALWLVFSLILFVAEPRFLHAWFHRRATEDPEAAFALVQRAHHVLLSLSALAIALGLLGAHGALY